ncbi:hypothetical protein D3C76_310610 [compost metagenome]
MHKDFFLTTEGAVALVMIDQDNSPFLYKVFIYIMVFMRGELPVDVLSSHKHPETDGRVGCEPLA